MYSKDTALAHHTIAIIGAGTMGHGIAAQAARCGAKVHLYDAQDDSLQRGMSQIEKSYQVALKKGKMEIDQVSASWERIKPYSPESNESLREACRGATLVIEAAPERLELKQAIFADVEDVVDQDAILATNTSSLSIDRIASALKYPERFLGLHFFNPVPIMPLLEIVRGEHTTEAIVESARQLAVDLLKTPIVVRDAPGFATSRLGIALGNEAMRIFEEGVASAEDIDRAMVLGYRHPIGPLALTDLVGLDVRLAISEYLYQELGTETFKPPQILRDKVAAGELGKKSGRGFYSY